MRVIISVFGKFHAFELAKQLHRAGNLKKIITSYPYSELRKFCLPAVKCESFILGEILRRIFSQNIFRYVLNEVFDFYVASRITSTDIFVGWAGFSLHSLRKAKKNGAIVIIENGSTHALFQKNILSEEYNILGINKKNFFNDKIIKKELQEYVEADFISVPSSFVKNTFLEMGVDEKKILHIPYGVDLLKFKKISKNDSIFRIIFVGTLSVRKGVHYLLQAYSELHLKNSELLLIGEISEEMRSFFYTYQKNVRWIHHVAHSELYTFLSQGSIFVMPSLEEGLALVILEAMACGLPVIATENSGARDVVLDGENGFIIPIRNVDVLKEKISFLYNNSDKTTSMGINAVNRVTFNFSWDNYGNRIVSTYNKLLKSK